MVLEKLWSWKYLASSFSMKIFDSSTLSILLSMRPILLSIRVDELFLFLLFFFLRGDSVVVKLLSPRRIFSASSGFIPSNNLKMDKYESIKVCSKRIVRTTT